ncbi:MAG: hypothetical protein ACRCVG_02090 [Methanobacteriaceae archaeon]
MSCLQIGFYLASWGMMRGKSFLLSKSVKNYENLIKAISNSNHKLWEIDLDNYNDENIEMIFDFKEEIINAFDNKNNPSKTLITKIMLGVYANVPAFDRYFCKGLKVNKFNEESLNKLKRFYDIFESTFKSFKINTKDFKSSNETSNVYTNAKLMDMYGFVLGMIKQDNSKKKHNSKKG